MRIFSNEMDLTTFEYRPLDPLRQQIRLCKITKNESSSITYTLKDFDLEGCPEYTALSYTWGAESPIYSIHVNGGIHSIRQNLFDFMNSEVLDTARYWWIDQLCINQSNVHERASQVSIMAEIFSKAEEVFVWLGPAEMDTHVFFKYMRDMVAYFKWNNAPADSPEMKFYRLEMNINTILATERIFSRSYWNRVWVCQELFLANRLVLCCGNHAFTETSGAYGCETPWFDLWDVLEFHYRALDRRWGRNAENLKERRKEIGHDHWGLWWDGLEILRWHRGGLRARMQMHSLSEAISYMQGQDCAEQRDKVYGCMGMVKFEHRIEIDYTISLEQLFLRVVLQAAEFESEKRAHPSVYQQRFGELYNFCGGSRELLGLDSNLLDVVECDLMIDDPLEPMPNNMGTLHSDRWLREDSQIARRWLRFLKYVARIVSSKLDSHSAV